MPVWLLAVIAAGRSLCRTRLRLYYADGSGRYWDTKEDVSREEAQSFRWTMDSNLLLLEMRMDMGGVIYRQYVVTFVDDETMVYRDKFDRSFMWDKAVCK